MHVLEILKRIGILSEMVKPLDLRNLLITKKGTFLRKSLVLGLLKKILLIYLTERERERERECTSRRSSRGRSRLPTAQGAQCGARSQDPRIMTRVDGRHLTT